jgi:hypothetical protein
MNKTLILILLIILTIGCKNKQICNLDNQVLKSNDSILLKAKTDKLLSKLLIEMEEPELEFSDNEIYRFMTLGAWGNKRFYRIFTDSNSITITSKKYWKYYDDKEIDSLGQEKTKKINTTDWKEIKKLLSELNFWSLPVMNDNEHVMDGKAYIIEGYSPIKNECTKRNYHATTRTSPRDSTLYKSLFIKIFELAPK